MYWEERLPTLFETVKVELYGKYQIGVFIFKSIQGYYVIDFGNIRRYLDSSTTFLVKK